MKFDRRTFLTAGGVGAVLATTGCDQVSQSLFPFLPPGEQRGGPYTSPGTDEIDLIRHYINRLSFGARPGDYDRVKAMGESPEQAVEAYLDEQLNPESLGDRKADYLVRRFETLTAPLGELFEYQEKLLLNELSRAAVLRAIYSKRQLYEVMVQFWTDHLNIDPSKGDCKWLKVADDREVIRRHAMGRFPELIRASALSPAMLWYLDGRVNRKEEKGGRPNENYARELLELHTLGVHSGYTQEDVMEVARCLTGWTVRSHNSLFSIGKVEFKKYLHDDGAKVVLGKTIPAGLGEGDLERVLEIVCLHPATARYLAFKLCRKFIHDEPSEEVVSVVADEFLRNGGDIKGTLKVLFLHPDFLSSRGRKFKRPFNFIVSALRATQARTVAGSPVMDYLTKMGHAPFQYPTPDGYPEEAQPWMGTLLWRWNFAVKLTRNSLPGVKVNLEQLVERFGGRSSVMAHLLGRRPTQTESAGYDASGEGAALMLASPGFQYF